MKALIMDCYPGTVLVLFAQSTHVNFICMHKSCKECLKIMYYNFCMQLIRLHAIQLFLKFTCDCLIALSSNKYHWD